MRGPAGIFLAVAVIVAIILAVSSVFTVGQTEQALVLRFGAPVAGRGLVTEPGLHFKLPFVENVVLIDKRILDVETPTLEVLAADNTRVEVDSFLKYRITDPLIFYQTVGDVDRANEQLGYILNSAVRRVLGTATLVEIVSGEREALMAHIRDEVNKQTRKLGVTAVDVRLRRTDLPRQISEKVFARMQSEWARQAALFRAQGNEEAQEIRAKADRDAAVLRADAQRDADQIRGAGDAESNRIFAGAFGKDPGFFAFYRSMQAYQTALKAANTRFVLDPKSAFFRFFSQVDGSAAASAPAAH